MSQTHSSQNLQLPVFILTFPCKATSWSEWNFQSSLLVAPGPMTGSGIYLKWFSFK